MTFTLNRRSILVGGALAAGGLAVAPTLAACDRGPTPEQVLAAKLAPVAIAALDDAAAARALSGTTPNYAAALTVVAAERDVHAKLLRDEITRLDPDAATRLAASTPAAAPTLATLRTRLAASVRQSVDIGVTLDGYRAGLLASVSASTTTLAKVQLA